jgi:hypothetical protein
MLARRSGLSGAGLGDGPTWNTGTGHSDRDFWGNIFTQANQTLQSFILTRNGVNPLALQQGQFNVGAQQSAWVYDPQTGGYYNRQTGQRTPADPQANGVTNTPGYLNLFGTQVSYGTLVIVGLGIFLLQSRGFSRR